MTTAVAAKGRARARARAAPAIVLCGAIALIVLAAAMPAGAPAEQASEPSSVAAGQIDAGGLHSCSLEAGEVRCWGAGNSGQLGYGDMRSIGDNEPPGAAGPVDLGPGRSAIAISAGDFHTCALLDDGSVRCWGFGGDGRLGYASTSNIGDDESPASAGPVNLGPGHTAVAITAGGAHSCAVLDTGRVLCWGFGEDGRLGYGDEATIGDDEPPGVVVPVDLGEDRTATAISAGNAHTCAVLDDRSVLCWGSNGGLFGGDGRLGYGDADVIGNNETPGSEDPVELGADATAISSGNFHTCAVLVGGSVRCWGNGVDGRLGYGDERAIGDNEVPVSVGPVDLGGPATAISAGNHTCARLVGGTVRCWGPGAGGRLGYGGTFDVGDDEDPAAVGPVALGAAASAVSAGSSHSCAMLAAPAVRCWGVGEFGRLGYGSESDIGDDETPLATAPVDLDTRGVSIGDAAVLESNAGQTAMTFTIRLSAPSDTPTSVSFASSDAGAGAPSDYGPRSGTLAFAPGDTTTTVSLPVEGDVVDESDESLLVTLHSPVGLAILRFQGNGTIFDDDGPPAAPPPSAAADSLEEALRRQARRAANLRACRTSAANKRRTARSSARRRYRRQPQVLARVLRQIDRAAAQRRARCLKTYGRVPGRVTSLAARRRSGSAIVLTFGAAGSDGSKLPAAQGYLVKQSRRPIRTTRDFDRATALCKATCRFDVMRVGETVRLNVSDLRRRTTYYYAVAARDNVSARRGPRSKTVAIKTR